MLSPSFLNKRKKRGSDLSSSGFEKSKAHVRNLWIMFSKTRRDEGDLSCKEIRVHLGLTQPLNAV